MSNDTPPPDPEAIARVLGSMQPEFDAHADRWGLPRKPALDGSWDDVEDVRAEERLRVARMERAIDVLNQLEAVMAANGLLRAVPTHRVVALLGEVDARRARAAFEVLIRAEHDVTYDLARVGWFVGAAFEAHLAVVRDGLAGWAAGRGVADRDAQAQAATVLAAVRAACPVGEGDGDGLVEAVAPAVLVPAVAVAVARLRQTAPPASGLWCEAVFSTFQQRLTPAAATEGHA